MSCGRSYWWGAVPEPSGNRPAGTRRCGARSSGWARLSLPATDPQATARPPIPPFCLFSFFLSLLQGGPFVWASPPLCSDALPPLPFLCVLPDRPSKILVHVKVQRSPSRWPLRKAPRPRRTRRRGLSRLRDRPQLRLRADKLPSPNHCERRDFLLVFKNLSLHVGTSHPTPRLACPRFSYYGSTYDKLEGPGYNAMRATSGMKVLRCEWARDCDERYGETASTTLCFHPPFLKSLSLTACAVLPCLVVLLFQVGFVGWFLGLPQQWRHLRSISDQPLAGPCLAVCACLVCA